MNQKFKQPNMKKYFVTLFLSILIAACGGNDTKQSSGTENKDSTSVTEKPVTSNDVTTNPDYQKGLTLISKSDCLTCHKPTEKLIGPSYKDVANKYAGSDTAVNYLVHKIKTGGKGVWGEAMMTGHPLLSEDDIRQMIKYIFLLKS